MYQYRRNSVCVSSWYIYIYVFVVYVYIYIRIYEVLYIRHWVALLPFSLKKIGRLGEVQTFTGIEL